MSIITSSSTTLITTRRRTTCVNVRLRPPLRSVFQPHCSDSKNSRRGFGTQPPSKDTTKKNKVIIPKDEKGVVLKQSKEAPGLSSQIVGRTNNISKEIEFEERLEAVRRSALEQKKTAENKLIELGPIDYDAPVDSEPEKIGFGTKIGVGAAVIVFGLVFALGDFFPSGSVSPTDEASIVNNKLSEEEKSTLQNSLKQYEATLSISPKDPTALEGAAVTLAELGEYARAASLLQDLTKEKPSDPDVFRLLGEVKYGLKDYEGSATAYKSSAEVSKTIDFEVLRGLANALLAAEKPNEAVQVILASRERLRTEKSNDSNKSADKTTDSELQQVDPIQVELLLGKAYSDWGHISDAVSVYDGLISSHPDDFRGYLAKGIILKENGNPGDAERMFIQARFFAPEKARALVDRYSRR